MFLVPLQFRKFSRRIQHEETPTEELEESVITRTTQPELTEDLPPTELLRILQDLDNWIKGEGYELQYDQEPRQLLAELIRKGISWDDDRSVPLSEWKKLIGGAASKYRFIQIEGMRSQDRELFFINFPRNKETYDLITALAKFKYFGKKSWNHQGGEIDKRTISSWLRRHKDEIISKLHPPEGMTTETPVACAVQFLALSSVLRRRAKLPQDAVELVEEILADVWREPPTVLSKEWGALIEDMRTRHTDRREFLFNELSIPQGRTGSINLIDPLPIIQHAMRLLDNFMIEPLDNQYFQGFWQSRYAVLSRMERYTELPEYLDKEQDEWRRIVSQLAGILLDAGYDTSRLKEALAQYCEDLLSVVEALKTTKLRTPDLVFDDMVKNRIFNERQSPWGTAVEKSKALLDNGTLEQLIVYDPKTLAEAHYALLYAHSYMQKVTKEIETQLSHIAEEGDPDVLTEELVKELHGIASLGEVVAATKASK